MDSTTTQIERQAKIAYISPPGVFRKPYTATALQIALKQATGCGIYFHRAKHAADIFDHLESRRGIRITVEQLAQAVGGSWKRARQGLRDLQLLGLVSYNAGRWKTCPGHYSIFPEALADLVERVIPTVEQKGTQIGRTMDTQEKKYNNLLGDSAPSAAEASLQLPPAPEDQERAAPALARDEVERDRLDLDQQITNYLGIVNLFWGSVAAAGIQNQLQRLREIAGDRPLADALGKLIAKMKTGPAYPLIRWHKAPGDHYLAAMLGIPAERLTQPRSAPEALPGDRKDCARELMQAEAASEIAGAPPVGTIARLDWDIARDRARFQAQSRRLIYRTPWVEAALTDWAEDRERLQAAVFARYDIATPATVATT